MLTSLHNSYLVLEKNDAYLTILLISSDKLVLAHYLHAKYSVTSNLSIQFYLIYNTIW